MNAAPLVLLTDFFSEDELIGLERLRGKPIDRSKKWVRVDDSHLPDIFGTVSSDTHKQVAALRLAHALLDRVTGKKKLDEDMALNLCGSIAVLSPHVGALLVKELRERRIFS